VTETTSRTNVLERLSEGIASLTSSDKWQEWLDVQSRFHQYSFNNTLLIQLQSPEATRVAGFNAWRKLERFVRKGEKGIWILAPMTHRVADDNDDENDGSSRRILSGFRPVPVFDIAQTDGETLPDSPVTRLAGEAPEHAYERLIAVAHGLDYSVEEDHLPGESNGVCVFNERCIRVEVTNDAAQQVKTLAHELAHAMLHEGYSDRALAELEAESVAYIVCNGIGLDSDTYSFGYVAGWAGGGDTAIAAIKASGQRIQQTANRILETVTTEQEVAA